MAGQYLFNHDVDSFAVYLQFLMLSNALIKLRLFLVPQCLEIFSKSHRFESRLLGLTSPGKPDKIPGKAEGPLVVGSWKFRLLHQEEQ
ncbi:MAG: hypothetical protein ABIG94_00740 [Pseudomonadota bacterium]